MPVATFNETSRPLQPLLDASHTLHPTPLEPFAISHLEETLVDIVRQVYTFIGWPGVVAMMAIESAAVPFPSEIIMPLAGWFLIRNPGLPRYWLFIAALLGALGNTLGSWLTYWVGAAGGRPLLERYGRFLLITHSDLDRADAWFARFGLIAVFTGRLLPVVRTFISIPAGVARMPFFSFSMLTFFGSYIWSFLLVWAGYILGSNYERVHSAMQPFDIPIALVLLIFAAWYVYRHIRVPTNGSGGPRDAR